MKAAKLTAVFVLVVLGVAVLSQDAKAQTDVDLLEGLVSWWQMEEASGVRYDSHGFSHLSDINTVGIGLGAVGNGAVFIAANNEQLSTASTAVYTAGNDYTIALYADFTTSSSGLTYLAIRQLTGTGPYEYQIYYNSGYFYFRISDSSGSPNYSTGSNCNALTIPGQAFIIASLESNIPTLWCNGQLTQAAGGPTTAYSNPSLVTYIGRGHTTSTNNILLDEVAYWSRALNQDEKEFLYNGGLWRGYGEIAETAVQTYKSQLPSGGRGLLTMSATAGELGTVSVLSALLALALFDTIRDIFRRARATK